jgi:2-oxoglutarate dehydrogenase E2 component (dihydrolipoamide succinyltransferase)
MKTQIQIPPLGESIVEATVGTLFKPSGSVVKADEEILELETDKVNQPVYAPQAGTLQLTVKTGDTVKVGQTIGFVESGGAAVASPPKIEATPPSPPKEVAPKPSPPKTPVVPPPSTPQDERVERKKMSRLRQVIAERLVEVKNQTAMLTTFNEVDMSGVMAVREREQENFQKKHGVKLGFMSFFVKATTLALKEFPAINGRIEGDELVYCKYYDMGIAVGTDKGLMVPVLKNADKMSYAEIEKTLKVYAEKARSGKLSLDELQGGTFTITNGGVYGSMLSTPILNPPQSGILGMHNIVKRAVVIGDKIEVRPIMYLALSYDHRIVDGKESIGFLMHIKKSLEEPERLMLEL